MNPYEFSNIRPPSQEETRNQIADLIYIESHRPRPNSELHSVLNEGAAILSELEERLLVLNPDSGDNLDDEPALILLGKVLRYHFTYTNDLYLIWPNNNQEAQDTIYDVQDQLTLARQNSVVGSRIKSKALIEAALDNEVVSTGAFITYVKNNISRIDLIGMVNEKSILDLRRLMLLSPKIRKQKINEQEADLTIRFILRLLLNAPQSDKPTSQETDSRSKYLEHYRDLAASADFNKKFQSVVLETYKRGVSLSRMSRLITG